MGLIASLLGLGQAVTAAGNSAAGLAEVFTPNATRRMELAAQGHAAALTEAGAEFQAAGTTPFDRLVNGLNRLPRPLLALGTLGLFGYAMADPAGFSVRMQGLDTVPEPLWWLLGAVVSFYFGAREAHYFRTGRPARAIGATPAEMRPEMPAAAAAESHPESSRPTPPAPPDAAAAPGDNAALADWLRRQDR